MVVPRRGRRALGRAIDGRALDVVAEVSALDDVLRPPAHEHEAVLVYAEAKTFSRAFRAKLAELARDTPTALIVPRVTPEIACTAAHARVQGLSTADDEREVAHVVREIRHGRVAYPPDAIPMLIAVV